MDEPLSRVERVVERALGRSVESVDRPPGGRMAETYLLALDGDPGRVVCKFGGPSVRTGEVIEPFVVELVSRTTTLPVPAVLASGTLREGNRQTRWALYEFRAGEPPDYHSLSAQQRGRIVREVGEVLGQLHARHQFERTGGLARDGQRLVVRDPAGLHVPERGRRRLPWWPGDSQPVLTHGDLFPDNLLVDPDGRITAVLDWGNAHVTTAGYALARAEMRFVDWSLFPASERRRLRDRLRAGYRQHRSLPVDYRPATAHKLLWLAQSGERHLRNAATSRGRRQLRQHVRSLLPWTL
jgi:aminoglycoside phosphotransferase (APT) family kinase protein